MAHPMGSEGEIIVELVLLSSTFFKDEFVVPLSIFFFNN